MIAENMNNVKLKVTDLSKRYKEPPVQALILKLMTGISFVSSVRRDVVNPLPCV